MWTKKKSPGLFAKREEMSRSFFYIPTNWQYIDNTFLKSNTYLESIAASCGLAPLANDPQPPPFEDTTAAAAAAAAADNGNDGIGVITPTPPFFALGSLRLRMLEIEKLVYPGVVEVFPTVGCPPSGVVGGGVFGGLSRDSGLCEKLELLLLLLLKPLAMLW